MDNVINKYLHDIKESVDSINVFIGEKWQDLTFSHFSIQALI